MMRSEKKIIGEKACASRVLSCIDNGAGIHETNVEQVIARIKERMENHLK